MPVEIRSRLRVFVARVLQLRLSFAGSTTAPLNAQPKNVCRCIFHGLEQQVRRTRILRWRDEVVSKIVLRRQVRGSLAQPGSLHRVSEEQ